MIGQEPSVMFPPTDADGECIIEHVALHQLRMKSSSERENESQRAAVSIVASVQHVCFQGEPRGLNQRIRQQMACVRPWSRSAW